MYGHLSARRLSPNYPQFYERVQGARAWDVDGREFVDMMCSFGPMILGYQHERVEQAAAAQREKGDTQPGPGAAMVELAELLTERVDHADWAMFGKNGSDATRLCLSAARATTGRRTWSCPRHSYHGWSGWSNQFADGQAGHADPETFRYTYNDLDSVRAAVAQADPENVAAIFVSPFRHDAGHDQELVDPLFAKGVRALCDEIGAALVMDEVRAGFRLHHGSSWEPLGVKPDLSAWSKAIANGYPLAATLGSDRFREGIEQVFATGSFWYQAVPMAAAVATIRALKDEDAVAKMEAAGTRLREGIAKQAGSTPSTSVRPGRFRYQTLASPATPTSEGHGVLRRGCRARRHPASAPQLVLVVGAYRCRHRPRARGDRRRIPRGAVPPLVLTD